MSEVPLLLQSWPASGVRNAWVWRGLEGNPLVLPHSPGKQIYVFDQQAGLSVDEQAIQGCLAHTNPPQEPIVALCLETRDIPRGLGVSYERGIPVLFFDGCATLPRTKYLLQGV